MSAGAASPAGRLRQGDIVIAPITPDAGPLKPRPAVVISTDEQLASSNDVEVVGVTGSFYPADPLFMELPHNPSGKGPTGFAKPSAAKRTWVQRFAQSSVQPTGKFLT